MSVSEYQRHQVFQWFEEQMGRERAAAMMSLLPPVGWGDLLTRAQFDAKLAEVRGELARLDGRIDKVEGRLLHELAKLRQHLYGVVIGGNVALAGVVLAATRGG